MPPGGVKAGDEFEAPFPDHMDGTTKDGAPTGKFKTDLFDCGPTCPCPFFMGWCCPGIMAGQVLQRLKYNAIGQPSTNNGYQNTCMIMTASFFAAWLLAVIVGALTDVGYIIWYAFYIYIIVALGFGRNNFRKRYNIPGTTFGNSELDDFCCAFWCGCCTVLQMHRHTHDENQYKYDITSKTGLPLNAPEIV